MIKTTPMLFNDAMVRALLDGRKTQTRRIMKPQPRILVGELFFWKENALTPEELLRLCPYGSVGELIYVREAWATDSQVDSVPPRQLSEGEPIFYPADGSVRKAGCSMIAPGKPRPSIHMPRRFSRLTLRITDVRVQRLQEISEADAIAEGCPAVSLWDLDAESTPPSHHFRALWDSINGDGAWAANPFVWAISFDVIRANVDDVLREQAA